MLEQVGRHAAPVPVAETGLLGGWLLARAGLALPDGPVSVAPHADLAVERDGDRVRVTGTMRRVAWGRAVGTVAVLADDPEGGALVLAVPVARAAVTPGTNLAAEPRDDLAVDGLGLSPDEAAPAPVGVDAEALWRRGALSRAALIAGAAGRVVDLTVGYTGEREQFGRPVARFQAVAGQLVQLAEQAEAAAMAARVAASPGTEPDVVAVAAAKAVASEAAGRVAALAHQATGAMGVTREYELGLLTRRLWSWRDEYGGERWWNTALGARLVAAGADALWPALAGDVSTPQDAHDRSGSPP